MEDQSDEALIAKVRQGDADALATVAEKLADELDGTDGKAELQYGAFRHGYMAQNYLPMTKTHLEFRSPLGVNQALEPASDRGFSMFWNDELVWLERDPSNNLAHIWAPHLSSGEGGYIGGPEAVSSPQWPLSTSSTDQTVAWHSLQLKNFAQQARVAASDHDHGGWIHSQTSMFENEYFRSNEDRWPDLYAHALFCTSGLTDFVASRSDNNRGAGDPAADDTAIGEILSEMEAVWGGVGQRVPVPSADFIWREDADDPFSSHFVVKRLDTNGKSLDTNGKIVYLVTAHYDYTLDRQEQQQHITLHVEDGTTTLETLQVDKPSWASDIALIDSTSDLGVTKITSDHTVYIVIE